MCIRDRIGSAGTLVKLDSQGTAQISCRASEQILIKNLPSGAWYKVTPVVDTDEGYRLTGQNNAAGMITASRIQEAAFSYTRQDVYKRQADGCQNESQPGTKSISLVIHDATSICKFYLRPSYKRFLTE